MTRELNQMLRLSLITLLAASLVNCAGRSEKQIEVQKRPATTPTAQPTPPTGGFGTPAPQSGDTTPVIVPDTGGTLPVPPAATPVVPQTLGTTPPPGTVINTPNPVVTPPVATPGPQANPQPLAQPLAQPLTPPPVATPPLSTPQTTPAPGTTNATITVSMDNGTVQQVQWDGLSDQGNARWKIETVNQ